MDIMRRGGGILATVVATRRASLDELVAAGLERLDSMLAFGVTTVEGKSGYGLDQDTEIRQLEAMRLISGRHPLDVVPTFMGAHALPPEYTDREAAFVDFLTEDVLPLVAERQLAEFCDVFCEKGVFSIEASRRLLLAARGHGLKLKLHADEIAALGGAELAAELGAVSADHLLQVSDRGIADIARAGVIATLLPGTAFSLKMPFAPARAMIDHGCALALSTDFNPGSCFSESIPLVFALAVRDMQIGIEEAVTALTIIGSIDRGKQADLIILEFPSYTFIPYHMGVSTVEKVIKNGAIVFDKTLVKACRHVF
jgi:imidazolonepropionase